MLLFVVARSHDHRRLCDCAAFVVSHGVCLAFASHVPKTNPSANAALATTGIHTAQICFSNLTRKSSICSARFAMLRRSESLALLTLATTPTSGWATSRRRLKRCVWTEFISEQD